MSKKKDSADKKPKVHDDLKGFDIKVNSFGEINSSMPIDELNKFLNKKVIDKKLKNRDDLDVKREEKE
jgi:hypothetical protein